MVLEGLAAAAVVGGDDHGGGGALLPPLVQDQEELAQEGVLLADGVLVGPVVVPVAVLVGVAQPNIEEARPLRLEVAQGKGGGDPVGAVVLVAREGVAGPAAGQKLPALVVDGDLVPGDAVATTEGHGKARGVVGGSAVEELPGGDGGHAVVPAAGGAAHLVEDRR
jgi:hypothetical protein